MAPALGVTPAGFVVPPLTTTLAGMQSQALQLISPSLDLSSATPDGQLLGIVANQVSSLWELGQIIYNAFNRGDVEGAGLDNLGDLTGTPREGEDYSVVYAVLALAPGTYAASAWDATTGQLESGVLVANVAGAGSQQYANNATLTPASLTGTVSVVSGNTGITFSANQTLDAGTVLVFASQPTVSYQLAAAIDASTSGSLTGQYSGTTTGSTTATPAVIAAMQSVAIGPTPTVNDGTLTEITTAVSGWISVNNPAIGSTPNSSQVQIGEAEENDSAYALRQAQDVADEGGDTADALTAQLLQLGAAQVPPITLQVTVLENTTNAFQNIEGLLMPPHSFTPIIWDGGIGWAEGVGLPLIAQVIYDNTPPGISSFGTQSYTIVDPYLGDQPVSFVIPAEEALYISVVVVPRAGVVWANLESAIQEALVAAAVAPTPSTGIPPVGQLLPGQPVLGSQISAVIMSVPGVLDIKTGLVGGLTVPLLTFGFAPSPINGQPITLVASQIPTISAATVATNVLIGMGAYP